MPRLETPNSRTASTPRQQVKKLFLAILRIMVSTSVSFRPTSGSLAPGPFAPVGPDDVAVLDKSFIGNQLAHVVIETVEEHDFIACLQAFLDLEHTQLRHAKRVDLP